MQRISIPPFVLVSALLTGCVGEASVSYQGSVIEGDQTAYEFAGASAEGTPISGTIVQICIDDGCGERKSIVDADGRYAEIEQVFGGFAGSETKIDVKVSAPDGRQFSYTTIYEDTSDPTYANLSCDPACPPVYLNFTLAPSS